MRVPSTFRCVRLMILAAPVTAALLAHPLPAAAAPTNDRAPHCRPGDRAAHTDPRCAVGAKPPPRVARGAPSGSKLGGRPQARRARLKSLSPGPLPGGGYIQLGAPADSRAVSTVQRRLTRSGFAVRRDGLYGPRTAAAVRRFQVTHRLLADAIVGRQTASALRHVTSKRSAAPPSPATGVPPKVGLGGAAQKKTRVVRAVAASKGRLTFDVRSLDADSIVSATLRSGRRRLSLDVPGLRSAVRSGGVAVRLVRRGGKGVAVVSAARAPRRTRRPSARAAAALRGKRLLVVVATAPGATSAQRPTPGATPGATPASAARKIRFGAFTPRDPYDGRTDATDALQATIGRHVDTVLWYQNWGGGDWISSVQPHLIEGVLASGRDPLLTWEPWNPGKGTNQPEFGLRHIAGGDFDAYITSWAKALKNVGRTVYLRPMHEMNGDWYPWGGSVNGNSPALYVQAWRRMHDIFVQQGATNVRWVWAPNNFDVPQTAGNRLEDHYPGASYVDVLGVDGYNWGTGDGRRWQSFSEVFSTAYERLRRLGPQPIWITEVGSAPQGGDKSAWIRDMFARAQGMDRLERIVWFNENKERDWRAGSPDVAAAFDSNAAAARAGSGQPRLRLQLGRRARAGRATAVRWTARGTGDVQRWHAYLNGRRVRTLKSAQPPVVTHRIRRPGKNRWRVEGRDRQNRKVVSASRSFRASRR